MWKEYSSGYIKNNRASSISIFVAALICALFLSFLCSISYNFWMYEVEQIIQEEGDWQGRITGEIDENDLLKIQTFGNVEKAVINEELSKQHQIVVDVYFENARTIFQDMPLLTEQLGLEEDSASYHLLLLSRYLIHDPQDKEPPLLMTFGLILLLMVSLSLILIIRNSFAMSMNARIHQFGIFSSIGATPGQIRTCLMQEAAMLCAVPVLLGALLGIALSFLVLQGITFITADIPGTHEAVFQYHPLVLIITILSSLLTVLLSALLPAIKLSRLTPLEAIRSTGDLQLKKKNHSPILSLLFGLEGQLAGNALKAQRKALRTSTLSLTLSFLGFTLMMCFFTLSGISTRYTYFERYQNAWDVMVTLKNRGMEDPELINDLKKQDGIRDCIVYQKAEATAIIPEKSISKELNALGGPEAVSGNAVKRDGHSWLVNAPVVILDDSGFAAYCRQIGITPRLDGTILLNQIWDSINSNFRYPDYIPFVEKQLQTIDLTLNHADQKNIFARLPVIASTQEVPVLREEYENYALIQFIPLSMWERISEQAQSGVSDTYIRILAEDGAELAGLNALQKDVVRILSQKYDLEIENRIQEKLTNDYMIWGYQLMIGGFCCMLAFIGIANVFSNTLSFLRQRKREFAQYMSVGMTPAGIRKMFCIEALVIAGRPLLITLPLTAAATGFMIAASHLNPMEFIAEAPFIPITAFSLVIFCFVGLAYYLGGKKVMRCSLSAALHDDTVF